MASSGQVVENRVTGERIKFVRTSADTGGALLEMEATWPGGRRRAQPHVHPELEERWEVLAGSARVRVGADEHSLDAGESVIAPPGTPHLAWNPQVAEARVRIEMRPALGWEAFVEELFALSGSDLPRAVSELVARYPREIAPAPPAWR